MSRIVVVLEKPEKILSDIKEPLFMVSLSEPKPRQPGSSIVSLKPVQHILERFKQDDLSDRIIEKIGMELYNLLKAHSAFENVCARMETGEPTVEPIYLLLKDGPTSDLDQLPWEMLYSPEIGFFCAGNKFPVARAKDVKTSLPDGGFEPPLKIMVVLGAPSETDKRDASSESREEWQNLYAAMTGPNEFDRLSVKVLHFDDVLLEEIQAQDSERIHIQTGHLTLEDKLYQDISEYKPHILHFFCHGEADSISRLCIRNYWNRVFYVDADTLYQYVGTGLKPWLVTLNCCESARKSGGGGSRSLPMAASLVTHGFPAAVGMREQVRTDLAHIFANSFYNILLVDLAAWIEAARKLGNAEVHWACALFAARRKICSTVHDAVSFDEAAPHAKEWTIPVLYTDSRIFKIRTPLSKKQARKLKEEAEQLEGDKEMIEALVRNNKEAEPILDDVNKYEDKLSRELKSACEEDAAPHRPIDFALSSTSKDSDGAERMLDIPPVLSCNAFADDGPATGQLVERPKVKEWLLDHFPPKVRTFLKASPHAEPWNWRDPRVGWGLVLPDKPGLSAEDQVWAKDAPEPIQALVKCRGEDGRPAPVLRYRPGANRIGFLHRDGADLPVSESLFGTGRAAVPRYLLIYGTPEQIPWEVQYSLNAARRAVGRLTLEGGALENYVYALMNDWKDAPVNPNAALIWAVDHGYGDITTLMRKSVALPVFEKLRGDQVVGPNTMYLDGSVGGATNASSLADALAGNRPGFILTTSHGMTAPLDNPELLREQLGLLVDSERVPVRIEDLLAHWQPAGAIWYAHACCSAGSDGQSMFDGLFEAGTMVDQVLKGVARAGAQVAPMPTALLGVSCPLRAFIGHVEPTFDWTLQARTGQYTTGIIANALYDDLYQPSPYPVGLAMGTVYGQLGGIYADYDRFVRIPRLSGMVNRLLVARDIQSTVILGDPTAVLPM